MQSCSVVTRMYIISVHAYNSLPIVCTALHCPAPTADLARTLTVYLELVFNPFTTVEVAGGDPETGGQLLQDVVSSVLYCT